MAFLKMVLAVANVIIISLFVNLIRNLTKLVKISLMFQ